MIWNRGMIITDVAEVHQEFQKVIDDAERLVDLEKRLNEDFGGAEALKVLKDTYASFNTNLKLVSARAADEATKGMRERIMSDRRRPSSGSIPPLEDLAEASPLAPIGSYQSGGVGVGNVDLLNRAINPHSRGYRSYWRAIEYGTGAGPVPSQVGRILYGSFTSAGGADPTAPIAGYAGGGGPHPVFISGGIQSSSMSASGTRVVGFGTIGVEIKGKHYIEFGTANAAIEWREGIADLQDRAITELRAIKLADS